MQDDNSWPLPLIASQVTYVSEPQWATICHHADSDIQLSLLFCRSNLSLGCWWQGAVCRMLCSVPWETLLCCVPWIICGVWERPQPSGWWESYSLEQLWKPGVPALPAQKGWTNIMLWERSLCLGWKKGEKKKPSLPAQCVCAVRCCLWILCSPNWGLPSPSYAYFIYPKERNSESGCILGCCCSPSVLAKFAL